MKKLILFIILLAYNIPFFGHGLCVTDSNEISHDLKSNIEKLGNDRSKIEEFINKQSYKDQIKILNYLRKESDITDLKISKIAQLINTLDYVSDSDFAKKVLPVILGASLVIYTLYKRKLLNKSYSIVKDGYIKVKSNVSTGISIITNKLYDIKSKLPGTSILNFDPKKILIYNPFHKTTAISENTDIPTLTPIATTLSLSSEAERLLLIECIKEMSTINKSMQEVHATLINKLLI